MITHFHRQFPVFHFPHFCSNQTCTLFESNFTLSQFNTPQKMKFGNFVYQIDCFMPFQLLNIFVGTFRTTFDTLLLCYCDTFYSTNSLTIPTLILFEWMHLMCMCVCARACECVQMYEGECFGTCKFVHVHLGPKLDVRCLLASQFNLYIRARFST